MVLGAKSWVKGSKTRSEGKDLRVRIVGVVVRLGLKEVELGPW